jgi:hypothetical protein
LAKPPSPRSLVLEEGMPITVGWTMALAAVLEALQIEGDDCEISVERGARQRVKKTTPEIRIGKARSTTTITACATGTTQSWGTGTVNPYDPILSGSLPQWSRTSREETIYNAFFPAAVASGKDVYTVRGVFGSYLILLGQAEC